MNFGFTVAGFIVGIAVGLTGIGGSALLAPILTLVMGLPPSLTVGTDLLYSVPTKIFACVLHARSGNVDWTITRQLICGGAPGAIVGLGVFAFLRGRIPTGLFEASLAHAIGAAVLLACVGILISLVPRRSAAEQPLVSKASTRWQVVSIGALVGLLVSITSIGAGSVTLPLLVFTLRAFPLRRLIGSEIAFAAVLVPLAALGHVAFHNVNWLIALSLIVGSLPGVWIGTQLASKLGERWLRPIVAGLLAVSGLKLV